MKTLLSSKSLGVDSLSFVSLFLRLAVGGGMLTHGLHKFMDFATLSTHFPDPIGVGSFWALVLATGAEVGCSLLLIFGLLTRFATLPLMFTMAMVVFVVNSSAPFAPRELAMMYLIAYITIFAIGAGKYSLDKILLKR